ncbi:hypothetical protein EES43_24225 [Streptomyces sp. ADI96-02]|nr:hypothetical protein EES43_24225 [Streptomyces sp. ADI96-02]
MRTAWDDHEAAGRYLSAAEEARLIVNLGRFRANQARRHPSGCKCSPCRIRIVSERRARAAEAASRYLATITPEGIR